MLPFQTSHFMLPEHKYALPPGSWLRQYLVARLLGHGGFGLTYLADDTNLRRKVAIKEMLPFDFAIREADGTTVAARSQGTRAISNGPENDLSRKAALWPRFNTHPSILGSFLRRSTGHCKCGAKIDGRAAKSGKRRSWKPAILPFRRRQLHASEFRRSQLHSGRLRGSLRPPQGDAWAMPRAIAYRAFGAGLRESDPEVLFRKGHHTPRVPACRGSNHAVVSPDSEASVAPAAPAGTHHVLSPTTPSTTTPRSPW
jgi:hypothetical protein